MAVECNAHLGDPPRQLIWVRTNGNKVSPGDSRLQISQDFKILFIKSIADSDAGLYMCVVTTSVGPLIADITVNVIGSFLVNPNLPRYLSITFGEPLHLDCRYLQDLDVRYSWLNSHNQELSSNHLLDLAPGDVIPGAYRCLAHTVSVAVQYTVIVTYPKVYHQQCQTYGQRTVPGECFQPTWLCCTQSEH